MESAYDLSLTCHHGQLVSSSPATALFYIQHDGKLICLGEYDLLMYITVLIVGILAVSCCYGTIFIDFENLNHSRGSVD